MALKKNNKGFTLAELLIVVAIIAVLVAIAVPVFNTQLEKSREATDMSNVRAAYAEVVTEYLSSGANAAKYASVTAKQVQNSWQNTENGKLWTRINGQEHSISFDAVVAPNKYLVTISSKGSVDVKQK